MGWASKANVLVLGRMGKERKRSGEPEEGGVCPALNLLGSVSLNKMGGLGVVW